MTEQENDTDTLRFDVYTIENHKDGMLVEQAFSNLSLIAAQLLFTGGAEMFNKAIEYHGWAGCKAPWHDNLPIVIVPRDELLDMDHLGFMLLSLMG